MLKYAGGANKALWCLLVLLLVVAAPRGHANTTEPSNTTGPSAPAAPPAPPTPISYIPLNLFNDLIVIHGFLVFFMQIGFATLELGYVRSKNVRNILMKNTVDILLCALCWWAVGYALENGPSKYGGFLGGTAVTGGSGPFFGETEGDWSSKSWFFTYTFALATVSIVGGCLAERTNLLAYPILTVVMSMWVYPVASYWAWSPISWLQTMAKCQFLDFAGGTVVHSVGGWMGLVGAALCGPRLGRFEDGKAKPMPGHDVSSVAIGTMFLWFGWFGFNCGSLYMQPNATQLPTVGLLVDRVALNMVLAASSAGMTALAASSMRTGTFDLLILCNGIMAGLVAATATCGFVAPWAALVTGIFAGAAYLGCSRLMLHLKVDDPLDSTAVHVVGGMVGTLMNGAFARPMYVTALLGGQCGGFVYGSSGGLQLGMQILGVVVVAAWTIFFSVLMFLPLQLLGRLRVDQATELAGIDNMEHGGPAYPEFSLAVMNNPSG